MTGAVFRPSSPAQKDPPSLPSPPLLFIVVVLEEKEEERLIVPLFLFPSFSSCLKAHCTVGNRRESTRGYWDWPFSRFALPSLSAVSVKEDHEVDRKCKNQCPFHSLYLAN